MKITKTSTNNAIALFSNTFALKQGKYRITFSARSYSIAGISQDYTDLQLAFIIGANATHTYTGTICIDNIMIEKIS